MRRCTTTLALALLVLLALAKGSDGARDVVIRGGKFINATAQLVNMGPAGHWDETFVPKAFGIFVNYTVIMQGTDPLTEEQCVHLPDQWTCSSSQVD